MKYFGHAQPCLNTLMWHLWIVLLLLQMPTHIQKIYLIPNPISAILLINNFEVLWAYPTMSDQTHLIYKSKCAASMDTCSNTKINLILTLILEILLIYHTEVLSTYPTMPDYIHLAFINRFVSYMDVYPFAKSLLHT